VLLKTSRQERAADKSIRLFAQLDQKGFRSSATLLLLLPSAGIDFPLDTSEGIGRGR